MYMFIILLFLYTEVLNYTCKRFSSAPLNKKIKLCCMTSLEMEKTRSISSITEQLMALSPAPEMKM